MKWRCRQSTTISAASASDASLSASARTSWLEWSTSPTREIRTIRPPSSSARERVNWGPAGSAMTSRLTLRDLPIQWCTRGAPERIRGSQDLFLRAVALPPLRPASFFCAVVPPCFELPPLPDFFPPFFDASGELAMRAARDLDMPLSLSASYCFSFFTFADFEGMLVTYPGPGKSLLPPSL